MFKGIIALFTSGLFFHPMVLGGIVAAVAVCLNWNSDEIYEILKTSYVYIAMFAIAVCYTFTFAKIYKEGGGEIDRLATFGRALANAVRLILAFVLTFSFMMMMSF